MLFGEAFVAIYWQNICKVVENEWSKTRNIKNRVNTVVPWTMKGLVTVGIIMWTKTLHAQLQVWLSHSPTWGHNVNDDEAHTNGGVSYTAPQCSVTRKDVHAAWITSRKAFSGSQVCAQNWTPLKGVSKSRRNLRDSTPEQRTGGQ